MKVERFEWHGLEVEVAYEQMRSDTDVYRFATKVFPPEAHIPLATPRFGFHFVSKEEVNEYPSFVSWLIASLDKDATAGLLNRNAKVLASKDQLGFDLSEPTRRQS